MGCEKPSSGTEKTNRGGSHLRIVKLSMNWLITGGSGQLGIAVSKELDTRGLAFTALSSKDLDVTDSKNVIDFIAQNSPTVIVNCAAWTDVDGAESNEESAFKVNGLGPENLALAAANIGGRFIHVSTDYVFSGESQKPFEIDDQIDPQSAYGRSKADGEKKVLTSYPENSYIVRTAWLYSAEGKNFAKTMTRLAMNGGGEVRVVNDQIGQPTSAVDLAKQIVDLGLGVAPAGIYHGTNGGQASWVEFAREIFSLAGADMNRVVPVSSSEYPRPAKRPSYSVLSHEEWSKTSIAPMRDWKIALASVMPAIVSIVKAEG
jgi:dTDP-4-dehydrorhamnose reductase